jgi:GT2 family glycosyltransferase
MRVQCPRGRVGRPRMLVSTRPTACVIFATKGRPEILAEAVGALANQTLPPLMVILSATSGSDVGDLGTRKDVTVIAGTIGLTNQRNAALRMVPDHIDLVVFFDDDFVPHPRWLESVSETFALHPDVAGITGNLIADGVSGKGLSLRESLELIDQYKTDRDEWISDSESPYGCNMAFRRTAISNMQFDERLVLVGWLEDRDFGARVAQRGGRLVKIGSALGVHRGVKTAKVSDRCLGYAQVVNPFYLHRKGTMTTRDLMKHLFKHMASNLFRSCLPEPHIDRFNRFRGNFIGLLDVLRRRAEPERAQQM